LKKVDCLFCRQKAQRGKEHVFSDALLKDLNAGREILLFERRAFSDDALEEARKHSYDSFQAGGICKSCSEGWMSALEGAVLAWLSEVRSKQDLLAFQDAKRRLTFARWAVKTACVIDHIGGMWKIPCDVPWQLFQAQDAIPENVKVLIGFHDAAEPTGLTFNQRNRWTFYPVHQHCKDPECRMDGMFFKVAFAVERLMVLVVGTPSTHFCPVIGTALHVPIWPELSVSNHHWFYSMSVDGCNAEEALRNFSDLFAVAHGGRMT
jgi:hypothetical protein